MKKIVLAALSFAFVACGGAGVMTLDVSESSFLTAVSYAPAAEKLTVTIGEKDYVYAEFDAAAWEDFTQSESRGSHYSKHIKDQYPSPETP